MISRAVGRAAGSWRWISPASRLLVACIATMVGCGSADLYGDPSAHHRSSETGPAAVDPDNRAADAGRSGTLLDSGARSDLDDAPLAVDAGDSGPAVAARSGSFVPGLRNATTRGRGSGIAKAGPNGVIDLSTSECFNRPLEQIWTYPKGHYKRPFMVKGSIGNTYDLRGVLIAANPVQFPVLFDDPHQTCIVGVSVQGQQPRTLTWSEMKTQEKGKVNLYDGDGVGWENSTGKFIIEGAWIDNVEDGIGPPFDLIPRRMAKPKASWSLRHAYFRHIRDDVIENDGCHDGELIDSFLDGIWTFNSSRGSKSDLKSSTKATLLVKDTLIRHVCMNDDRGKRSTTCGGGSRGAGQIFKVGGGCNLSITFENVVFLIEGLRTDGGDFPAGTYKNVTVVWAAGGNYPVAVPAGIKVTKDRSVWDKARAKWLERHGCNDRAEGCEYIDQGSTKKSPPPNTAPYVAVSTSPAIAIPTQGGTLQWWTENVSSCTPVGRGLTLYGDAGQRRIGPRQISGWKTAEQQIMYGVTCKAHDGATVAGFDRLTWFNQTSDAKTPSVPAGVKTVALTDGIRVSWNEATDNYSVASYRVYRNGVWISNVSAKPEYLDRSVDSGTAYVYEIQAQDSFGNLSGKSMPVNGAAE